MFPEFGIDRRDFPPELDVLRGARGGTFGCQRRFGRQHARRHLFLCSGPHRGRNLDHPRLKDSSDVQQGTGADHPHRGRRAHADAGRDGGGTAARAHPGARPPSTR